MTSLKFYTGIFVALFVLATVQALIESVGLLHDAYWVAFALITVLSVAKALAVAGYFQHLRWEPRSLSYLMLMGTLAAVALTLAASYSIL